MRIALDDVTLEVEDTGAGTPVLLLHGWPDAAKKDFFDKLMPAHAHSLKGESLRTLDFNMLAKQLDTVLATPLPKPEDAVRGSSAIPVLDDVVSGPGFTPEEAQRIGLVEESAIDWNGEVDIDLSADPEGEADVSAQHIGLARNTGLGRQDERGRTSPAS